MKNTIKPLGYVQAPENKQVNKAKPVNKIAPRTYKINPDGTISLLGEDTFDQDKRNASWE